MTGARTKMKKYADYTHPEKIQLDIAKIVLPLPRLF